MTTSPGSANPYASPATDVDDLDPKLARPRRWFWWMLCDAVYITTFCIGLLTALVAGAAFLIALAIQSGDLSNIFDERGQMLALVAAILTMIQAFVASVLFGLLLGWIPRLPVLPVRLTIVLLPPLTHPLTLLFTRLGDQISPVGPAAAIVVGSVGVSFGLYLVAQNVQLFLAPIGKLRISGGSIATEVRAEWMRRVIDVQLPEGTVRVDYDGRKLGSETVLLDGVVVGRGFSPLQLAPRFAFTIGARRAELHVTGWPWMCIRSLVLAVDGVIVYRSGF